MPSRSKSGAKPAARPADETPGEDPSEPAALAAAPEARPAQTQANFDEFAQLLAPAKYSLPLGKNISLFQPDVEVLALTLKDMPLNSEQFGAMSHGREWVSMSFCVLNVGPPGFSNVPYTNGKKKGEKEVNPLMLYDVNADGNTCFHSFEKGKTNKDKGVRVSQFKDTEQVDGAEAEVVRDATCVLERGVMMSFFMREENFSKSGDEKCNKMFVLDSSLDDAVVLKANSLVYLQMSSANVEQAKKGMGLKMRKLKSVAPSDPVFNGCFHGLPVGEAAHNAVMDRARKQHAIARMLCKDEEKAFAVDVSPTAYATKEDSSSFMLCDAHCDVPLVTFTLPQLMQLFDVRDEMQALKLVNVAIALKALRLFVCVNNNPTVAMQTSTPFSVGCMQIDWNVMLHMHLVAGFDTWPCSDSYSSLVLLTHAVDGVVFWSDPAQRVVVPGSEKKRVVYAITLAAAPLTSSDASVTHLVSEHGRDAGGGGHTLDIFLSSLSCIAEVAELAMAVVKSPDASGSTPGAAHVLRVSLRPDNKGASAGKKRKRLDLLS